MLKHTLFKIDHNIVMYEKDRNVNYNPLWVCDKPISSKFDNLANTYPNTPKPYRDSPKLTRFNV